MWPFPLHGQQIIVRSDSKLPIRKDGTRKALPRVLRELELERLPGALSKAKRQGPVSPEVLQGMSTAVVHVRILSWYLFVHVLRQSGLF